MNSYKISASENSITNKLSIHNNYLTQSNYLELRENIKNATFNEIYQERDNHYKHVLDVVRWLVATSEARVLF